MPLFVPGKVDPATFFARVAVISLKRTPQRLEDFRRGLIDWPFADPEHFPACDGEQLPMPAWFQSGGPAYGCLQSHLAIFQHAADQHFDRPVLILEDDCEFVPEVSQTLPDLLERVPGDADLFYVGCQIRNPFTVIGDGLVRADTGADRTHAYVAYPRLFARMPDLLKFASIHVDQEFARLALAKQITAYAASPVQAIQRANYSTLRYRQVGPASWDKRVPVLKRDPEKVPIVWLEAPRETVEELRRQNLVHTGYHREATTGIDMGLRKLMMLNAASRDRPLCELVKLLQEEAAAFETVVCGLWHPDLTAEIVAQCCRQPVVQVSGDLPQIVDKLKQLT